MTYLPIGGNWKLLTEAQRDGGWYLLGFFGGGGAEAFPPAQVGIWDGEQWSGDWVMNSGISHGYSDMQPTHYYAEVLWRENP
jgi:hypothetical protein